MFHAEIELLTNGVDAAHRAHVVVAANYLAQLDDRECRTWIATLLALRSLSRRLTARGQDAYDNMRQERA